MSSEMFVGTPFEGALRVLAPDPTVFPAFVKRMIAIEFEPRAPGRGHQVDHIARTDHRRGCGCVDLHRFRSGQVLMLGGLLFEGHG
jgi:hypothetical protein